MIKEVERHLTIPEIQKHITYIHDELNQHVGELSDTYHSFDDLYKHRLVLTAALFRNIPFTWKARIHEDGTMFDGMFIVGVTTPDGDATYHYDLEHWDRFNVPELPHAPKFDGHTPELAMQRIEKFFARGTIQYNDAEMRDLWEQLKRVAESFDVDDAGWEAWLRTFIKDEK